MRGLKIIKQIHEILNRNNIKHIFTLYQDYGRFYIPQSEAKKIVFDWGLNNQKHLTKFRVFEKFKVFLPFTSTSERLSLLNGKISLSKLGEVSGRRRIEHKSTAPRGLEPRTS